MLGYVYALKARGFTPMHMAMQTIAPLESFRHLLEVLDGKADCTQCDP